MCLILKRNAKVETSPRAITVYKRLKSDGGAPYRGTRYRRGELKVVDKFTTVRGGRGVSFIKQLPSNVYIVNRGLHVYATKRKAMMDGTSGLIVECTIPRHTPFVRGTHGEIVTLKLRVGKAVGWDWYKVRWSDKTEYAKRFNRRRKGVK